MHIDTDKDTDIYLHSYMYKYQLVRVDFGRGKPRRANRGNQRLL